MKKKKECKSEIYSRLVSPIRQHYHISERFQKATKINYMLKLSYKLLSNHIDNNDENMPRKGSHNRYNFTIDFFFQLFPLQH